MKLVLIVVAPALVAFVWHAHIFPHAKLSVPCGQEKKKLWNLSAPAIGSDRPSRKIRSAQTFGAAANKKKSAVFGTGPRPPLRVRGLYQVCISGRQYTTEFDFARASRHCRDSFLLLLHAVLSTWVLCIMAEPRPTKTLGRPLADSPKARIGRGLAESRFGRDCPF